MFTAFSVQEDAFQGPWGQAGGANLEAHGATADLMLNAVAEGAAEELEELTVGGVKGRRVKDGS